MHRIAVYTHTTRSYQFRSFSWGRHRTTLELFVGVRHHATEKCTACGYPLTRWRARRAAEAPVCARPQAYAKKWHPRELAEAAKAEL